LATHRSAVKQDRTSKVRKMRNVKIKSYVKTTIKNVRKAIDQKDLQSATEGLVKAIPALNKAASKGVIHKKNASRRVSRLTRRVNKLASDEQ